MACDIKIKFNPPESWLVLCPPHHFENTHIYWYILKTYILGLKINKTNISRHSVKKSKHMPKQQVPTIALYWPIRSLKKIALPCSCKSDNPSYLLFSLLNHTTTTPTREKRPLWPLRPLWMVCSQAAADNLIHRHKLWCYKATPPLVYVWTNIWC